MRSQTGFCVLFVGCSCWFVASSVIAEPAHILTLSDDAPPVTYAQNVRTFDAVDGYNASIPHDCTACNVCYRWQVWANALFLTRSSAENLALAFGDPNTPKGSEVFGSDDLNFGFGWGPQVGLFYCLDPCNSIGVEFYAIDDWTSTGEAAGNISVQFPSLPYLPELLNPNDPISGYGVATFRYSSNLYNTEINFRHRTNVDWLTTLAGFRWIEIGEQFDTLFATGGTTPHYSINVNNHLYGFQLGAVANVRNSSPWFFDGWLKAGIFANAADQDTTEDFTSAGGVVTFTAAEDSDMAFAGDIGVSLGRRLTDRLSARLGYMALWIEGVALAPEQLDNSDPSSGVVSLDSSGGVFYHGGFVGLEYLW
ncbi:MAG: BBP7 family outer membrane beta-barrel protein [Pirellulaceae bacterium]